MSSSIKKIEKNIEENDFIYYSVLNTFYGSLIQSIMIFNPDLSCNKDIFLKRLSKCEFPTLEDPNLFTKTVETFFGEDKVIEGDYLLVVSQWNTLVFPALKNDEGDWVPIPFFPDKALPATLAHPDKIYKINLKDNVSTLIYDFKGGEE